MLWQTSPMAVVLVYKALDVILQLPFTLQVTCTDSMLSTLYWLIYKTAELVRQLAEGMEGFLKGGTYTLHSAKITACHLFLESVIRAGTILHFIHLPQLPALFQQLGALNMLEISVEEHKQGYPSQSK